MIKIDKNIPIPEKKGGAPRKHPDLSIILKEMDIGDSVVFAVDSQQKGQPVSSAATRMRTTAHAIGMKITQRTSEDKKTVRVWKIA